MYDLHNLGWNSFQDLCVTVTREVLGQTVQSFLPSRDGGRDGAFSGTWKRQGSEDLKGRVVIQCKFTGKSDYVIKAADLTDEVEKVKRLVRKKRCDIYVLITNAGVSGTGEEEIETLSKAVGAEHVLTLGADWLSQQIRENKRLRMSVPRVYGLGDLSQILDERAYSQARAILETMNEDLAKVVVTDAYRRAAEALDKHSFVLLVGEPAAGKTTIASMLAMAAIDQWGASTLKLEDPAKVVDRWNPGEPSQFFWIDDAFGVTQYEDFLVRLEPCVSAHQVDAAQGREDRYDVARLHLQPRAEGPQGECISAAQGGQGCHRRSQADDPGEAANPLQPPQAREAAARLSVGDQAAPRDDRGARPVHS
jgi:energy-coupling factor transporter ATP-binding protein EcfA2